MSKFSRAYNIRTPQQVVRICTEGKKTEPNYFNSIKDELRLNEIDIKVYGLGDHTLSLIDWIVDRKDEEDLERSGFITEWWAVFDKDDHEDFNRAIEKARKNDIKVAYSNECFELWFILHFEYLQSSLGRNNFNAKLTTLLSRKYEKNESDIYYLIKEKENDAIRNAKNLEKMHDTQNIKSFEQRDPSTLVYELVERLRLLKVL